MLNVSGLEVTGSVVAPKRKRETPYDAIIRKVEQQKAIQELKEIEEIKKKPKEERTFAENLKLSYYQTERLLAAIEELPTVIYVA